MLKRLMASRRKQNKNSPTLPTGMRVFAVGDIHGRLDLLEQLLGVIESDNQSRGPIDSLHLVFLGDLVDRGPDSAGVIERLLSLKASGRSATFLLGNHDEVFLKATLGDVKATRFLTKIGGKETILSYGITPDEYLASGFEELTKLLQERVPAEHREFLSGFSDSTRIGDYLFVHAGIRPGVPLEEQVPTDLRWIRGDFLSCNTMHDAMVVHGHSISEEPELKTNRIGIDTGAFASGRLTALGLEGDKQWVLCAEGAPDPAWNKLTD